MRRRAPRDRRNNATRSLVADSEASLAVAFLAEKVVVTSHYWIAANMLVRPTPPDAATLSAIAQTWTGLGVRSWHKVPRALLVSALVVVLAGFTRGVHAQDVAAIRAAQVKSAYLYNFGKYVQWPANVMSVAEEGDSPFVMGVVGHSPVLDPLRVIVRTKTLKNKQIAVRQFLDEEEYQTCHILFIPADQDEKLVAAILKRAQGSATLIVGESEGFAHRTGMINFYVGDNRLRFEINKGAAEKAGLKISALLLRLGKVVESD